MQAGSPLLFIAHANDPSLGDETAEGHVGFDRWSLRFQSGNFIIEIPLARLEIDLSKNKNGPILFSDPEQEGCLISTFDHRVLALPVLCQHPNTRQQIRNIREHADLKRRYIITGGFIGAILLLVLLAPVLTGFMINSLVSRVPPKWEQDLGDSQLAELKSTETFIDDPKLKARVDEALSPLLAVIPSGGVKFQSYIIQDDDPNAFALPGGHLMVTTGLLKLLDRPEEIAGTAAHEIAHVTCKHGLRQILSEGGSFLVLQLFLSGRGVVNLVGAGSAVLVSQGFSQEYELEADSVGWNYLIASHVDPRGMISTLRKLREEELKHKEFSELPQAFSSHPATDKRISRLEKSWKKLRVKTGFIQWPAPKEP
jgi:Putative Zn-dependent protease, contains TPR repeats